MKRQGLMWILLMATALWCVGCPELLDVEADPEKDTVYDDPASTETITEETNEPLNTDTEAPSKTHTETVDEPNESDIPQGREDGANDDTDANKEADTVAVTQKDAYTVVSNENYERQPTSGCGPDEWIDYGCDGWDNDCHAENKRIGILPDDESACPVCVSPSDDDPDTCSGWQQQYGDFLGHLIADSCANWCEDSTDCFAWEIHNSCGSFVVSLYGAIDEEPIHFAEVFANENCGQCSLVEQTLAMRRYKSDIIKGDPDEHSLLLELGPYCWQNKCVLVPLTTLEN